jgi:hypothetical protein
MTRFFAKMLVIYRYQIYPEAKNYRGATRLLQYLERLSRIGIHKIDEEEAVSVFQKEDWENLIILDACRSDLYFESTDIDSSRITLGSNSAEYFKKNFSEGEYDNVVYVSANPHVHNSVFEDLTGRKSDEVFHEVFHVYQTDWHKELGTVKPSSMIEKTITARKLFPEKKIISHFMQPHHPFIQNPVGEGFSKKLDNEELEVEVWRLGEKGEISQEELWKRYKGNLEYTLEEVEKLVSNITGKTVITSDHGNHVGENGLYGHPFNAKTRPLREVPWHVMDD